MKKHILIFSILLISTITFSQVGINTTNPQGTFNIDGGNDNSVSPTATEQLNDVIVLPNGNTGLGTTAPTTKLEIKTTTTSTAVTGFKLTDGNEAEGRLMKGDANGVGTWQPINMTRKVQLGKFPTSAALSYSSTTAGTTPIYSNAYIVLEPGKWIVHAGLTIYVDYTSAVYGDSFSLHTYLSSDKSSLQNNNFNFIGSDKMSGRMIKNTWAGSPCLIQGTNVIEVTGTDPVTIYVLIENKTTTEEKWRFSTGNWENYLHAVPVN